VVCIQRSPCPSSIPAGSCLLFPWLHTQRECLRTEKTQSKVAVKNTDAEWNPQREWLWISIIEISQLCIPSHNLGSTTTFVPWIRWCPWNHNYSRHSISFLGWYFLKYIIFRWRWCRRWRDGGRTWLFNSLYDMRRECLPVLNSTFSFPVLPLLGKKTHYSIQKDTHLKAITFTKIFPHWHAYQYIFNLELKKRFGNLHVVLDSKVTCELFTPNTAWWTECDQPDTSTTKGKHREVANCPNYQYWYQGKGSASQPHLDLY